MVKAFKTCQVVGVGADDHEHTRTSIDLITRSQKFIMPPGGVLFDDPKFRAIETAKEIHLPFDVVALEVPQCDSRFPVKGPRVDQTIILLWIEGRALKVRCFVRFFGMGGWRAWRDINIPLSPFLTNGSVNGYRKINAEFHADMLEQGPGEDFTPELITVASFLNAVQCANVHVERVCQTKVGSVRAALGYDEYHILTVSGHQEHELTGATRDGRSPREHLRRGHIRTLSSGKTVWVNSCVVNAGKTGGRIEKDYRMAA